MSHLNIIRKVRRFYSGWLITLFCMPLVSCIEYDISGTLDPNGFNVECRDGVDNDYDGWLDKQDPDCASRLAITELGFGTAICNDGLDNDGDGKQDAEDEHCLNAIYPHENGVVGDILITEFLANPLQKTDAYGEWIELYNNTAIAVDIHGWILQDSVGSHVIGNSVIIPAHGYIVLSRGTSGANGLPAAASAAYVYGSAITLSNSGDSITLLDPAGVVVAEVLFTASQITEGASTIVSGQLFDGSLPVDSSQAQDALNWCFSKVVMNGTGSDKASPGKANEVCL